MPAPVIAIRDLEFAYPGAPRPVLRGVSLTVDAGQRLLLVGANGAGKTTLLSLIGGKHLIVDDKVRVLGRPAFTDTSLCGRVAFIGGAFPLDIDLTVEEILAARPQADAARRELLVRVLGVDRGWHMHRVSDGQRRRVQILLALLAPCEILLLDEVTTDLDIVARGDLLAFLRRETEERGTSIVYATHILDGLDTWASHLAFLEGGRIRLQARLDDIPGLAALRRSGSPAPLLRLVEGWLRHETEPQ